ncbi:hypothetical protein N0V83_007792 [Neocucurbitaria cava]|uniref:Uncharacterized protein n=1 Tax=Neocucurbitaria cava TaxID=798079 RepID=A0A9W8Y3E2_9PLEO|nr:hypothetical protein N0V83_007792 [Neocucurbitaria cava]
MPLIRPPPPSTSSPTPTSPKQQLPTLAPCPRPDYVANKDDWFQITSPKPFPDLDICSSCYNTSFCNTRYGGCISKAPPKPENVSTRCDFSDTWCRIAYLWLFKQNAPDLDLLGSVAAIRHDEDGACPNLDLTNPEAKNGAKPPVTRTWSCLYDPKTNSLVEDLTVCSDCVAHIHLMFPCLRGIFCPVANGQKLLATCDFFMRGIRQPRFLEYVDNFTNLAEKTLETGTRDVSPLIEHIRKWAPIPSCMRGAVVAGEKRYALPSTVADFTACQECYMKYVQPLPSKSPPPQIVSQLESSIPPPGSGFTCDLYSPRLQQYFQDAATSNDIQAYRQKLVARSNKLQEINLQIRNLRQEHRQLKAQSDMHMSMMRMEQTSAMTTSMAWSVSSWSAPPIDWRASNAHMSQGNQLALQAAMRLDSITMLEAEWAEHWE